MIQQTQKNCFFCTQNALFIDWKNADLLRRFLTPQGKISSRRRSGICASHQRQLARSIKRARSMSLLPYSMR